MKQNQSKPKLLLIDGNAVIHRSFHALPLTLTTKEGEIVNAVYGFASFLLKAIKEFDPTYIVLALDKKGPTFRHEAYEAYKATRTKAPQELYDQFDRVRQVAQILGVPIFELSGFEADDVIGSIARQSGHEVDTIIATGDQDAMQLVDQSTQVYTMGRGFNDAALYGPEEVKAKYGFEPKLMIDYKALRGDPSDNIPGVKGIGDKTAVDLIQRFGDLAAIYQHLEDDTVKPRTRELLKAGQESAELSKHLATIDVMAPVSLDLAAARFGDFDEEAVVELFSQLEFRSLIVKLREIAKHYQPEQELSLEQKLKQRQQQYKIISSDKEFTAFCKTLAKQSCFAFDAETTGLDNFTANIRGLSFCWQAGEAYFVPVEEVAAELNLFSFSEATKDRLSSRLKALAPILADANIKKVGHNLKFEIKLLASLGIEVNGITFDTMIAAYLLRPDNRQYDLDSLAFSELAMVKISKEELTGSKSKVKDFAAVPMETLAIYGAEDADATWQLYQKLAPQLVEQQLQTLFTDLEMPLVSVLARLENAGVKLDIDYLHTLDLELDKQLADLQQQIWQAAGEEFNIASVKQLQEILFTKLELSVQGLTKTKTGFSTGAAELEKLVGSHPIVALILAWRELAKMSSTYVKSLPQLVNAKTGRLHTNYNQAVAATGRLSSSNPNLQNIPTRSELGQSIRKAFVASEGKCLLSIDYSQIELRLAAHMSGDDGLVQAFREHRDIHQATAAAINHVPFDEVTKAMRRAAKAINFGLLYGQGARGLSVTADISYAEAKAFIEKYFQEFAGIKNYMEACYEQAREQGFVETLLGRRRYIPEIQSSVAMIRKAAERTAVNTPLQGTAADMIKLAMIETDKFLAGRQDVKMILQVHDELVFELDNNLVSQLAPKLTAIMEGVMELSVPLETEVKVGNNWAEMKKINL